MESQRFYIPIRSLINLVLTGGRDIINNSNPIIIDPKFTDSLSCNNGNNYNEYFLNCIRLFLETCRYEERIDLLSVYQDNHLLLVGTSILNGLLFDSAIAEGNDFETILDSMFSDYITDGEVTPTLCIVIYFYIENLSNINIVDGIVSRSEYEKTINFNSIKRDLNDVFNF